MNRIRPSRPTSLSNVDAARPARGTGHSASPLWLEKTMAAVAVVLSVLAVTRADAAPVHYEEPVSGDLAVLGPTKIFNGLHLDL